MKLIKSKLFHITIIIFIVVVVCGGVLLYMYNSIGNTPNYKVYINDNGSAEILVYNIAYVNQLPDGTLIVEGGGEPEEYNYTRRDKVNGYR